ncbi:MAG: hypothetical protein KF830_01670 [Planctomycetes bacterium]|nr:hypothetical protein [Planctomycetota bacterium]
MTWHPLCVLHAVPTLLLCGLIWFVQVVHYPLLAMVGHEQGPAYEREHCRRIGPLVAPAMLAEAALAVALWWSAPPAAAAWTRLGLGLLGLVWAATFVLQVPCHRRLSTALDAALVRRLVATNWIRTAAWTLRAALAVVLLLQSGSA